MTQAANDVSNTLNGLYKQVYASELEQLVPDGEYLMKEIKFAEGEQSQGGTYNQPVALALEQGVTFAAAGNVVNLNASIAGQLQNAQVDGYQIYLRSQIGYAAASRASKGKKAFKQATEMVFENMRLSHYRIAEAQTLYGQSGMGIISAVTAIDPSFTISAATFAEGIWVGKKNAKLDIMVGATGVLRQTVTITRVDILNRKIYVDGLGAIAVSDQIYFHGAYGNEQAGMYKILSNSGGTLFGINASDYELWQSESYAAGGAALTFNKLGLALVQVMPKGGMGNYTILCHPLTWQNLCNEVGALRDFGGDQWSPKQVEIGTSRLKFHNVVGTIDVVASSFVKQSHAFVFRKDDWRFIGSSFITMRIPGVKDGDVFLHMPNATGFEIRSFSDMALFCSKPGGQMLITGITPSVA